MKLGHLKINNIKFSKPTYILLLIVVAIVAGTLNFTFAATLTDTSANPATTLGFKGTQIAVGFTTTTTTDVKSIDLELPDNTGIGVAQFVVAQALDSDGTILANSNLGTTSQVNSNAANPILTFTFDNPVSASADTEWSLLVIKVRNPAVTGAINTSMDIVTRDGGGSEIDRATAAYGLQELYDADEILDAINSKSGDICIGSGCP